MMNIRPGSRAARKLVCVFLATGTLGACASAIQTRPEDIPVLEQSVAQSATADRLTQLGMAYYQAQRYAEAKTTLQRAAQAGSKDATTTLYLGLTNEELGDFTAARAAYEQYLATGGSSMKKDIQARIALVARKELKQQAKTALEREQQLATETPTRNSIAVMPFRLVGIPDDMKPLQTALAEMIVTDIGFTQLTSIERVRVQTMLDEMVLTIGGVADEQTGARMGRLLRAERVVQGQLNGTGGQAISVDAVVLNVAERTPGNPVTRQGQLASIFDLEKQLVFGILDEARYQLSPAEREKINENKAANLLAFLAYGRGLEALDRGDYDQANAQFRQATQMDPSFSAARVQANEASQLNDAATKTTNEIAIQNSPTIETTQSSLAHEIAADLNPSPAQTVVASTTDNNGTTQVNTTGQDRTAPTTEATQSPQISQAKKANVVITVTNPTPRIVQAAKPATTQVRKGGK